MNQDRTQAFNIDCVEYMKDIPDKYFDLAVVDPPYGIGINVSMGRRKGDAKSEYHKFAGEDKEIPKKEYWDDLFRVSKNQIVWGGNYMIDFLYPSPCWILWDKKFSEDVTFAQFEMAWTSFTTSAKKFDQRPNQQARIHPTQKPIALYDWIFKNYLPEGGKVLDTHLGSGSSRISAHKAGNIDFVGCELDPDYFEAQEKRYKQFISQLTLF